MRKDYIDQIRSKIGHDPLILTFACGILINDKNEVLLQKRSEFGKWGIPGGAVEFGETLIETCQREFKEETGLTVSVENLLGISSNQFQRDPNGDETQAIMVNFIVNEDNHKIIPHDNENTDLKYFDIDHLPPIFNLQHERAIKNYYTNNFPYYE